MAAHARLEDDEVVRIARSQGQVIDFGLVDGAAGRDSRGFQHRRASGHLHRSGNIADLELCIDYGFRARVQHDAGTALRFEPGLLHRE